MEEFGDYVRRLREKKGITLRKFAQKVGITPTYLSKIERKEMPTMPSEETIAAIAEHLGADFEELMIMAKRIPSEIPAIIMQHPREMNALLRMAKKLSPEQIINLTRQGEEVAKGGSK